MVYGVLCLYAAFKVARRPGMSAAQARAAAGSVTDPACQVLLHLQHLPCLSAQSILISPRACLWVWWV